MRKILCFLSLTCLVSCYHDQMDLEDLKKASWKTLEKGIDYISIDSYAGSVPDSVLYTIKGTDPDKPEVLESLHRIFPELEKTITGILNDKLPKSKQGYLRLNLGKYLIPDTFLVNVFLKEDMDSLQAGSIGKTISQMAGVIDVKFVSKEEAEKIYLDDGNQDWSKVLVENPLPASFSVGFRSEGITEKQIIKFKEDMESSTWPELEVSYPAVFLKNPNSCIIYLEYGRD